VSGAATRAEWMEFDLAVLASGGVTVPIYPSDLVNECGYIIWNSGAAIVCVENARQLAKIREAQQQGFLLDGRACQIAVRQIVSLEDTGDGSVVSVQQLMERGRSVAAAVLQQRIGRIGRDQPTTKAGLRLPAERSEWAADPRVGKLSGAEVAEVNRRLASYESIKYHRILPRDFSPEGGELTPSLKVKRKVIVERYRDLIEGMY
jgi:long-subunit acyl-CoA synthetase (AMP-forming)